MNQTPTYVRVLFALMLPSALANVALALLAAAYLGSFWLSLGSLSMGVYCHWVWTKRPGRD